MAILMLVAGGGLLIGMVAGYCCGVRDHSEYPSQGKQPPGALDPRALANQMAYYPVWPFLQAQQPLIGDKARSPARP